MEIGDEISIVKVDVTEDDLDLFLHLQKRLFNDASFTKFTVFVSSLYQLTIMND